MQPSEPPQDGREWRVVAKRDYASSPGFWTYMIPWEEFRSLYWQAERGLLWMFHRQAGKRVFEIVVRERESTPP